MSCYKRWQAIEGETLAEIVEIFGLVDLEASGLCFGDLEPVVEIFA